METVFKKNEDIFLPKDAVSPLGGLMPAVYQKVGRQGPAASPLGWGCMGLACLWPEAPGPWALLGDSSDFPSPQCHMASDTPQGLGYAGDYAWAHTMVVPFAIPSCPALSLVLSPFPDEQKQ